MAVVGKTEIELGEVANRVDLVVEGKIRIKGSDIELGNGNISMSGALVATGSITTDGNMSAGVNATGSFDHIITGQNTIEFRDSTDRTKAIGYLKFDETDGLVPLNKSKGNLSRKADSVPYSGLTGTVPTWNQSTTGNAATTSETTITNAQASAISANTLKTGISDSQAAAIAANTKKVGITPAQTKAITENTAKTGVSKAQGQLLEALGKGITIKDIGLSISKDRENNLVITDGSHTWKIAAQDR